MFHRASLHPSQFLTSLTYIAFSNKLLECRTRHVGFTMTRKVSQSCSFPFSSSFLSLCSFPSLVFYFPRHYHSMHIHIRTAIHIFQSLSSFIVDVSSMYHPHASFLSIIKNKKTDLQSSPSNRTSYQRPHPLNSPTLYIKHRTLLLRHCVH